jgi:hypothetical protein
MIDPQTLIGLHIEEAIKLLAEQNSSFCYTYLDRRANRWDTDYQHPNRYNIQVNADDVVVRARIG